MRDRLLKLLTALMATGVGIVLFEAAVQGLVRLGVMHSFSSMYATTIRDAVLLYRLPAGLYGDVDEQGYRNPSVPERCSVVALGDSQTYGYNAFSHQSWPRRLGQRLDDCVYNMGIGGYGPAQYYALLDEALVLDPDAIVMGLYLGNDLMDACRVFREPYWHRFAQERDLDVEVCRRHGNEASRQALPLGVRLRSLARYSETLMMFKQIPVVRAHLSRRRDLGLARSQPERFHAVNEEGLRTVVMLGRLDAMRQDEARPRAGRRLTEFFLEQMLQRLGEVHLVVLFVPTKANVLYEHLASRSDVRLPSTYHSLVGVERELARELARFVEERGASAITTLPRMQEALRDEGPLFLEYADGHPTALGYQAMADAAYEGYFARRSAPARPGAR